MCDPCGYSLDDLSMVFIALSSNSNESTEVTTKSINQYNYTVFVDLSKPAYFTMSLTANESNSKPCRKNQISISYQGQVYTYDVIFYGHSRPSIHLLPPQVGNHIFELRVLDFPKCGVSLDSPWPHILYLQIRYADPILSLPETDATVPQADTTVPETENVETDIFYEVSLLKFRYNCHQKIEAFRFRNRLDAVKQARIILAKFNESTSDLTFEEPLTFRNNCDRYTLKITKGFLKSST